MKALFLRGCTSKVWCLPRCGTFLASKDSTGRIKIYGGKLQEEALEGTTPTRTIPVDGSVTVTRWMDLLSHMWAIIDWFYGPFGHVEFRSMWCIYGVCLVAFWYTSHHCTLKVLENTSQATNRMESTAYCSIQYASPKLWFKTTFQCFWCHGDGRGATETVRQKKDMSQKRLIVLT